MAVLLMVFTVSCQDSIDQDRQGENLAAFSKLYGIVKYFHPSDEAKFINWNKLALYGVNKTRDAQNNDELAARLLEVFRPVAPTLRIRNRQKASEPFMQYYQSLIDSDTTELKTVAWQHFGVDLQNKSGIYSSYRTHSDDPFNERMLSLDQDSKIFNEYPEIGETTIKKLGNDIFAEVPLALYGDSSGSLPISSKKKLDILKNQLSTLDTDINGSNTENIRLANIVITWNIFQHFYPYFEIINTDWVEQLYTSLKQTLSVDSTEEYNGILQKLLASLKDGHITLRHPSIQTDGTLPFLVDLIEGKVVVTHSLHDKIKKGDIIISLNGVSAQVVIDTLSSQISGSPQYVKYRALRNFGTGEYKTEITFTVQHEEKIESYTINRIARNTIRSIDKTLPPTIPEITKGIYYVDLDRTSWENINSHLEDIANSKGVIFDLRGYPKRNHLILTHLLETPDTSGQWMKIPKRIYPDRKNTVGFEKKGWFLKPEEPHIKGNVVFITDARAISYAESVMSFVEHYQLGEIVGQPTAGTNGNVNPVELLGDYRFRWTGLEVTKHDGSQHHLVGITPTIPVEKTIRGIREGKDEFLEKALQIVSKYHGLVK